MLFVREPTCSYCLCKANLVGGDVMYPHRPDLADRKFWKCVKCNDVFVGCHKDGAPVTLPGGERVTSDGSIPVGTLANRQLREARKRAHSVFDLLWKNTSRPSVSRTLHYSRLAQHLGIDVTKCHIGYFDEETCNKVYKFATDRVSIAGSDALGRWK